MRAHLTTALKSSLGCIVTRLGLPSLLHRGHVLILTYHRVLPADRLHDFVVEPGMYVTDTAFRRHMVFLKAHYDVLSMGEWLDSWSGGGLDRKGRYCLVTFDDGWRDNFDFAFPILRNFRLPATIFLATGFVGTNEWFWTEKMTFLLLRGDLQRLSSSRQATDATRVAWDVICALTAKHHHAIHRSQFAEDVSQTIQLLKGHPVETLDTLCHELSLALDVEFPAHRICIDWPEIAQMAAAGIAFGSHSNSHAMCTQMSPEGVERELVDSRRILESHRVNFTPVFCYPNGAFNSRIAAQVSQAGYLAAVTTQYGSESLIPTDRFAIRRIAIHHDVTKTNALLGLRLCAVPRPSLHVQPKIAPTTC